MPPPRRADGPPRRAEPPRYPDDRQHPGRYPPADGQPPRGDRHRPWREDPREYRPHPDDDRWSDDYSPRHHDEPYPDRGQATRRNRSQWDDEPPYGPPRRTGREPHHGHHPGHRYDPGRDDASHDDPSRYDPSREDPGREDAGNHAQARGRTGPTNQDRRDPNHGAEPPRKLTVTRVAAWRSRQLTQQGIAAFRRAANAHGADRSGLTALTFPVMASNAADAALAVALANTLFFSAATAESKANVALYLLITVAPFALLAPVIGPLLDRLQRGRRVALSASFLGRTLLALVMAQHFDDWLLYPAALGFLVLTRSFGLLKAAVTPRVLPAAMTLTKTNSRLAMFGLAAGAAAGTVAAGFAWAFGSAGSLWFTAAVCIVGAWLCLRIPAWVEVTEGEVPASLLDHGDQGRPPGRRREPLGRHVVVALWGNGTIRILTGFLTLFVAFVVKAQAEGSAWRQVVVLVAVGAAAGIGNLTGNALGARQHFAKPDQVILTCLGVVLGAALLAAMIGNVTSAIVVGLIGSACSSLAKVCQDAVIQRDMPEESRASAFGRTETILQLSWTFGGALGVLLPPVYWLGFTVISALLMVGTVQTVLAHRGRTLLRRPSVGRRGRAARPGSTPSGGGNPNTSPDSRRTAGSEPEPGPQRERS